MTFGKHAHRGGVAADGLTGDGCGLLLRQPDAFLRRLAAEAGRVVRMLDLLGDNAPRIMSTSQSDLSARMEAGRIGPWQSGAVLRRSLSPA